MLNTMEGVIIQSHGVEPTLIPYLMTPLLWQWITMYNRYFLFFCIRNLKSSQHKLIKLQATHDQHININSDTVQHVTINWRTI